MQRSIVGMIRFCLLATSWLTRFAFCVLRSVFCALRFAFTRCASSMDSAVFKFKEEVESSWPKKKNEELDKSGKN